jgi:hypothetical protein
MPEKSTVKLNEAFELANRFRYSDEGYIKSDSTLKTDISRYKLFYSQNHLKVTEQVTPQLKQCLNNVYDHLYIDKNAIEAYVYPDSNIQAECLSSGQDECIIKFSSGLIERLEPEEIEFVAGHEIGHFLLSHTRSHEDPTKTQSLDYYIQKRAQEISADRIGYIACGSLEVSLRALMKTISGLSNKHLRFDIGGFLNQIRSIKNIGDDVHLGENKASHPSILLRSRALLWFSILFDEKREACDKSSIKKVDKNIKKDLDEFEDKAARVMMNEAKESVKFWSLVLNIVQKQSFKKKDQELIKDEFGFDKLNSLKNMLNGLTKYQVVPEVQNKLEQARQELYNLAPISFKQEMDDVHQYLTRYN